MAKKHKCKTCGMIEWSTSPHTGALHDRIRKARGGKLRRAVAAVRRRRR